MVAQNLTAEDAILAAMRAAAFEGARALSGTDPGAIVIKPDGTPQTAADLASDAAIRARLAADAPDVPIVSEELITELPPDFADRPFLLVDPLDGTREYMQGHPDHAVCIALIVGRRPRFGVIVAPAMRKAWIAGNDAREYTLSPDLEPVGTGRRISAAVERGEVRHLVTSRSRPDPVLAALMPGMPGASIRHVGAVLKLVAVATGEACLFPASNPSSEWDIAAGEALILAAGGTMLGLDATPLTYGHAERGFLNKPYVAGANAGLVSAALDQWPAKSLAT